MRKNLKRVGGATYTDEERRLAEKVRESFTGDLPPLSLASEAE